MIVTRSYCVAYDMMELCYCCLKGFCSACEEMLVEPKKMGYYVKTAVT